MNQELVLWNLNGLQEGEVLKKPATGAKNDKDGTKVLWGRWAGDTGPSMSHGDTTVLLRCGGDSGDGQIDAHCVLKNE